LSDYNYLRYTTLRKHEQSNDLRAQQRVYSRAKLDYVKTRILKFHILKKRRTKCIQRYRTCFHEVQQ